MICGQADTQSAQNEEGNANEAEKWFLLQTKNHLVGVSEQEDDKAAVYYQFEYEPDEIIVMPKGFYTIKSRQADCALMYYKKGQKRIDVLPLPINLLENSLYTVYHSSDSIQNVVMSIDAYGHKPIFYIADNFQYLKEWHI